MASTIPDAKNSEESLFELDDFSSTAMAAALDGHDGIVHENALGYHYDNFEDILPGVSARTGFGRRDYEQHRPNEAVPKKYDKIIQSCDKMYYSFGLVRYVVDLMADFTCQGIQIIHPVPSIQKFYEAWFQKVCGYERSERFCNYMYRHNMVTVRSLNTKLPKSKIRKFAKSSQDFKYEVDKIAKNEIPLKYRFLPADKVYAKENYLLGEKPQYVYRDNRGGFSVENEHGQVIKTEAINLPQDKTFVYYFKKDDWQAKPVPFLFPLIKHWIMINKLNLADSTALDGAISNVRIWKLGNVDHKIAPGPALVNKLDEILRSNTGGGTMDIIWDPNIELQESKTTIHQFLGEEKYRPHLNFLYVGLGLPPTLVGTQGGSTNNYISLKTLMKRLQYGRERLIEFWTEQAKIVQKAMGFAKPATFEFDYLDFAEEAAEKALLIQLADRNIISEERLQAIFGYDPETEKRRLNKEEKDRKAGRRVTKTSPWHDPQLEASMKKIALQRGYITPEQAGIDIPDEYNEQDTPYDLQLQMQQNRQSGKMKDDSPDGTKSNGRPRGAKDTEKRKSKEFKPVMKAALDLWCSDAHKFLHDELKPVILAHAGKSSLRELTADEVNYFDKLRFGVLFNMEPLAELDESTLADALDTKLNMKHYTEYEEFLNQISSEYGSNLTMAQADSIKTLVYINNIES